MTQPLPAITPKQQELIRLLYRHRFLSRKQIQILMHHTDKRRISSWLKDLREKQYIEWIYQPDDPIESTKPAIYYLGINGIRFLRKLGEYSEDELRKRYKESSRQQDFIDRCLLLADCCIHLDARNKDDDVIYTYAIEADYTNPDSDYAFLSESEYIHPDLAFTKEAKTDDGLTSQTYFLQVFDFTTPRYMAKKKLEAYIEYFADDEWERYKGDEELPIVLFACPTLPGLIYAKRYTKKQLEEHELQDREDVRIRFAMTEQMKRQGVTGLIWEEV